MFYVKLQIYFEQDMLKLYLLIVGYNIWQHG